MKRFSKELVVALAAAAMLAGCGGKNAANTGEVSEVDFLVSSSAATADKFIWNDILEKQFGLKVNFEMAAQDAHLEKLQLLIASNNLPDIMSPIPSDTAKKIGTSGMLLNFNDHLKEMPNFDAISKTNPVSYVSLFAEDGGMYIAPQYSKEVDNVDYFRYVPTIRADLVEEVGMKMPQTYDELYEVLSAIKQKHPETVGIINRTGTDIFKDYGYTYGARPDVCYNYEEDKYMFGPETENYKQMLQYMNKMWNAGLLDPEIFTASKVQFESKLVNGLGVFYMDWGVYSSDYTKTHKSLLGEGETDSFSLVPIGPINPEIYPRKIVQKMEDTNIYCSYAVSSQTKAAEKIVKFIDWLYSDEGADVAQYGIKGEQYNVDETGKYKFNETIIAPYNDDATIARDKDLGIYLPHIRRITTNKEYQEADEYVLRTRQALEEYKKNDYGYMVNNGINLTFTEAETEKKSEISSDITTCVNEWSIGFVTGTKSFDEYDTFIAETKSRGIDELVEIYNTAYDRFKKKLADIS